MLTDQGKVNQVVAKLGTQKAYAYGESWCRVVEEIREEVNVGDIDKYLTLRLKLFKLEEGDADYDTIQNELDEVTSNLGMWIGHALSANVYVDQEETIKERAERWFNTRLCFFDAEEAAVGIGLSKKKAKTVYLENKHEESDDWSEEEEEDC